MLRAYILHFFLLICFQSKAQLCSGTLGAPIFWEDFGSGAALYGPPLPLGTTNYVYQTGIPSNGTYVISNNANPSGATGYVPDDDNTGNLNGYMMVVNSDYPATEVYRKNVTGLCPNTTYVFSAFLANNNTPAAAAANCGAGYIYANIKFQVEYPLSLIQGSISTGNLPLGSNGTNLNWIQYGFIFTTSASQTSCSVVMLNNAPGGCGNDYVVDDITLSPCGPGINLSASPSTIVCGGQSAILQSTYTVGSYTLPQYQWQYSSNGSSWTDVIGANASNYTIASSSFSNSGFYRLLASENGNISSPNCRIIAGPINFSVTNAAITVNSASVCSLQNATLTATGATGYTWSTGSTNSSIVVNPVSTTSYTVSGSVSACTTSAIATVSVIPFSTITISGNTLICPGSTASLIASGALTYSWNPSGIIGSTFTANPLNTTIYTVTGQSNGFCGVNSTIAITVPPALTLTVSSTSPSTCVSNSITLTAAGSGGIPGYTYTWTGGPVSSTYTVSQTAGSYVYTVTGSDQNNCFATATKTISFINNPVISVSSSSICSGLTGTLSASGANTYTWLPSMNTGSLFTANPASTSVYSVTGTSLSNCTTTASASIVVLPNPVIGVTSTLICNGSSATLSANGAPTYTWIPSGTNGTTFTTNPIITTTYIVTGTGINGCTASATATVTVPPALSLNITASSPSACVGNIVTLIASNSGGMPGYTYTWTGGPSAASYSVSQVTGNYVYTVTSADFNNCSAKQTVTLDFIANPVITVPDVSICPGSSGTLNALGANTYTWYPSSTNGVTFTASPLTTTVYSVTGTAASGCSANATASIIVKPTPSLSFQTATITCANLGSATVTPSGGIGPFSYTWMPTAQNSSIATGLYPGTYTLSVFDGSTTCTSTSFTNFISLIPFTGTVSSTSSIVCNGIPTGTASVDLSGGSGAQTYSWTSPASISQISATVNALSAGIHTISVTDGITFCNVTHTFLITQPTAQTLNVNATPNLACVGSSVSLTANNSGGTPGYTYTWIAGPSATSHTVTEIVGGTYIYTVQSQDSYNCPSTNTVAVTFVDYPVISSPGTSICLGSGTVLTANGASSYTWNPGNFSGNNFSISPIANTSYTLIGGISGCNDTLVTSVIVYTLPIAIISGTNTFCQGQTLNLTGSGGTSYLWNGPSNATSSLTNLTINDVPLNYSGIYSLLVASAEGCTATTSQSLTIIPRPFISVSGANVCIGMTTTLSASGGVSYFWNGPSGYTSTSSLAVIPVVNNTNTGIYTVVITGSNSCISSGSVEIIGFPYALPVPTISTDSTICVNSTIVLQGNGGISYLWNGPGGFTSTLATPTLIASGVGMSGIYTLSVKNNSNCAASSTVSITVYSLPTATLVGSKNKGCVPFCSDFYLYAPSPTYPIVSTDFLIKGLSVADSSFNYCFLNAEDYPVKVIITDMNGCVNTSSLLVSGWPLPKAEFSYLPTVPVENEDIIHFTDNSSGASINTWSWYFTSNNGDSSRFRNPEYMYKKAGIFPVALVVKNKWGCSDTLVKTIKVNDNFSFYVPNSFTPNGDGINDIFQPKGVGVMKYAIEIFDRWGEKIFNSTIFETGWDGTYKGAPCKADIYIWKIELVNPSGKNLNYSGHVSLLEN